MSQKRSGFSLVLSLAIMASMVMMVIVLAAFLQVETRLAQSHSGYMRARLNAMAAAKIALGQLQQLAGPDQRVTMRADMYDKGDAPGATSSATVPQTGTSDSIYNPSAPKGGKLSHQKRYWTGVWCTGGADSTKVRDWDVMNPHESRLFLGWLCSPSAISDSSNSFFEIAEFKKKPLPNYIPNRSYFVSKKQKDGVMRNELANPKGNDGQILIDDLSEDITASPDAALVPLVSRGTIKIPQTAVTRFSAEYFGQIDALPIPLPGPISSNTNTTLGINGRYAFWVGDEGIKAKANLPDAYASVTTDGRGFKTEINSWDDGLRGSAAQRNAIELITAKDLLSPTTLPSGFDFGAWRTLDVKASGSFEATTLSRVRNLNDLALWANSVGGASAGNAMKEATKALFHDVTASSYSTITDTYNGGIKLDLSTTFELPYVQYRGLEMYFGQKKNSITPNRDDRKVSLFHGATNRSRPTSAGGSGGSADDYELDFNRPNYETNSQYSRAKPNFNELLKASPRAPEWAATYVGKKVGGASYSNLVEYSQGEDPERVGFVYEVPLRSAFWDGEVFRINPIPNNSKGENNDPVLKDSANLNARIERGPTWDLFRNFYRIYKLEIEQCHRDSAIRGQDNSNFADGQTLFSRGIEPLTNSTFQQNAPKNNSPDSPALWTSLNFTQGPIGWFKGNEESRGNISNYYNYATIAPEPQYRMHDLWSEQKNPKSTKPTQPSLPWPTSMKLAPSIIRFAFMYSTVWKPLPGYTGDVLGVAVDPIIVVHNPYDCAIEFPGITMLTSERQLTTVFQFTLNGKQIGDVNTGQTFSQARPFSFRAIAGENGNSPAFRLEPGEVQVITPVGEFTELSGYNSIEIPGQFKKYVSLTDTCMFFPMDPFALNVKMLSSVYTKSTPLNLTEYPLKKDPTNLVIGPYVNNAVNMTSSGNPSMTSTDRTLFTDVVSGKVKNSKSSPLITGVIPDWDGKDFTRLRYASGDLKIKTFNNDGDNLDDSETRGIYVFGERKYRGGGHILDGGSQKWDFFLQFKKDYAGNDLSPYRRWSGPVYEPALWKDSPSDLRPKSVPAQYVGLINGSQSVYNIDAVDESLLLSFRGLTSGWPLYGNAASSYTTGKRDPEFPNASVQGFYNGTTIYSTSLSLPDSEESRPVSRDSIKNYFFIMDFFLRGSADCMISSTKIYPRGDAFQNPNTVTPEELRAAPMSPFAFSSRAQLASFFSYDGKSHAPVGWVASQRSITDGDFKIPYDTKNLKGYWGNSAITKGSEGSRPVILFNIPRRPLLSLVQLGSASVSQDSANPDLSVGSSFAHPGIKDLNKICDWPGSKGGSCYDEVNDPYIPEHGYAVKVTSGDGGFAKSVRGRTTVRTDIAFASNLALWDSYWLSGLNTQEPSYSNNSGSWPTGPNLPTHNTVKNMQQVSLNLATNKNVSKIDATSMDGIKEALDSGYNPLANKRVCYKADSTINDTNLSLGLFPDFLSFPHPSYIGRHSLYNGGFNVNSTSKAAWKAVLGAMKTQKMPDGKVSQGTPLTRFARAFGSDNGAAKPWESYHDISDDELDDLAAAVVNEVRRRGPFMSLSDFVNRRLINDDNFGLKGALQAAIDATSINNNAITATGGTFATKKGISLNGYGPVNSYFPIKASDRFPSARAMMKDKSSNKDEAPRVIGGLGAPGMISQMDILNSVGPNLTARSDTFIIRAFGEAFDNNGNSIGKAWIEVLTQRTPDFLALTDQQARQLNISAEPNIRATAYRDNNPNAAESDYDAKPIVDMFQRNTPEKKNEKQLVNLNRLLGRRFKAVSVRWLSQQDI